MKMKKVIGIILALAMLMTAALLVTSCGKEEGKLVMATNAAFPPYEFKDGDKIVGIDAEIAEAIAGELGLELEIVDTEFGSIIGGVQTGKYDIGMAGMTVTDERKESVNFSNTYAKAKQVVIVPADSEIESFEEFYTEFDADGNPAAVADGVKIGVQQDTTGDIYSSDDPEKWGFGEDNVLRYKTGADAVQALLAGKVTCVIIDNEPAKSFVAANEGLKILDGAYADEDYAIAVGKDNEELLKNINDALAKLTESGKLDEIVAKYIPAE